MSTEISGATGRKSKSNHPIYDDKTLETMKRYFKVEEDHDILLRYLKDNRIRTSTDSNE